MAKFNTVQSNVLSCCFPQLILSLWEDDLGEKVISNPRTVFRPPVTFLITVVIMIMITIEQLPLTTACRANLFHIPLSFNPHSMLS